ncbi:MAG: PTS sugar transporter subunit IIA [Phycisphaerales bacterium]|nr:PTS sugar transporter subunit IIA [Planctomycetota bacterium]
MLKFAQLIAPGAIVPQLRSTQRDETITELIDAVVQSGVVPAKIRDELKLKVLERERKGSTGFGRGVAVPHVKHKAITRMAAAIGLSQRGIDFNALDKQPVHSVVLLISPEDKPEEHLQAMEVIFKNLSKETFRKMLRQADTAEDVKQLLTDADNQQLPA